MGEDIARCPSCSLLIRVIYNLGEREREAGGGAGGERRKGKKHRVPT